MLYYKKKSQKTVIQVGYLILNINIRYLLFIYLCNASNNFILKETWNYLFHILARFNHIGVLVEKEFISLFVVTVINIKYSNLDFHT